MTFMDDSNLLIINYIYVDFFTSIRSNPKLLICMMNQLLQLLLIALTNYNYLCNVICLEFIVNLSSNSRLD